jgi:hypothetical protein
MVKAVQMSLLLQTDAYHFIVGSVALFTTHFLFDALFPCFALSFIHTLIL